MSFSPCLPEAIFPTFWYRSDDTVQIASDAQVKHQRKYTLKLFESKKTVPYWLLATFILLYTLWNVGYGVYHNILYYFELVPRSNPIWGIHRFQYVFFDSILDFRGQSHLLLLIHSVGGALFLPACLIHTTIVPYTVGAKTAKGTRIHRWLGTFTLIGSFIASTTAFVLSWQTLYGTALIYLLGSAMWVLSTVLTAVRARERDLLLHRRWALVLQEIGLMFTTSRLIYPVLLAFGMSIPNAYFWGVWGAGVLAFGHFSWAEGRSNKVLAELMAKKADIQISTDDSKDPPVSKIHIGGGDKAAAHSLEITYSPLYGLLGCAFCIFFFGVFLVSLMLWYASNLCKNMAGDCIELYNALTVLQGISLLCLVSAMCSRTLFVKEPLVRARLARTQEEEEPEPQTKPADAQENPPPAPAAAPKIQLQSLQGKTKQNQQTRKKTPHRHLQLPPKIQLQSLQGKTKLSPHEWKSTFPTLLPCSNLHQFSNNRTHVQICSNRLANKAMRLLHLCQLYQRT
eukprot:TRINITY_DN66462_c6_g1_i1.p1 TRINITY_DN66462_c6_g1~~TRINITY_DN66462_c6_g1_i1.p1  ORF type:complete len:512 (+),score=21.41 TRINITY_DN66462_c6_g1_i1:29-1564(+)